MEKLTQNNSDLTDENAILILNEHAKVDPYALKLMILLQNAKEFGESDMIISKIHHYLRENSEDV